MKTKLGKIWESLHNSFWFVPLLMVLSAIALAYIMLSLDHGDKDWLQGLPLTYSRGPEGAREVLSTVAGSMVSVATTAFSIVIVALQLASGQFGPRLIGNFMRDTGNQIVLGTFISTFVYCLLILRTVNSIDDDEFVPHLSVAFSIVLAIFGVAVLIYFLHHVATSIQAQQVIANVGTKLSETIERLFPQKVGRSTAKDKQEIKNTDIPDNFEEEASSIRSDKSGYIQAIDNEELIEIAAKFDVIVRLNYRPGDYVVQGNNLVSVWHGQQMNRKLAKKLKGIFIIDNQRSPQQDLEFSINQLVEIAVRALSTGVNDPFTANRCIDQLSAALCHFAQKEIPSRYRYDENKKLRVIAEPTTFASVVDTAFNQIRQAGQTDVAVTIRLLEAIARIAQYTTTKEQRAALLRHAQMIERGSHEGISEELDKKDVQERYFAVLKLLKAQ
ncbi:DUF2254 domain-containing protein [Chroogloeocystis siderophila]|uniref:DUF2254 domain-containing protein n=1 Tax=Chroogloeocystis siderophila 5.2 s.c.1 TaxID=247279 RepID=A0A1U7HZ41_9CHRO|nr:DUF2254 domain-containing protein [Chroogloeocystis siderophila]OKH28918.1 hypothetical protein NIES1031_03230 [Chroogloeocystis siderophila 5.2 s.c.1]